MTDVELLSRRLVSIEKQLRWVKRIAVVAGLMIVAGALFAQRGETLQDQILTRKPEVNNGTTTESEVRAQHFVLVDSKGKERASLVADQAGSVFLVLFDAREKTRLQLAV